jgi:hypothetical protein
VRVLFRTGAGKRSGGGFQLQGRVAPQEEAALSARSARSGPADALAPCATSAPPLFPFTPPPGADKHSFLLCPVDGTLRYTRRAPAERPTEADPAQDFDLDLDDIRVRFSQPQFRATRALLEVRPPSRPAARPPPPAAAIHAPWGSHRRQFLTPAALPPLPHARPSTATKPARRTTRCGQSAGRTPVRPPPARRQHAAPPARCRAAKLWKGKQHDRLCRCSAC